MGSVDDDEEDYDSRNSVDGCERCAGSGSYDPPSQNPRRPGHPLYDRWGIEWGEADEAAAVWFKRTKKRLANGKNKAASRALGYLAHIIGDVAQPMHTDSSDKEDGVHSSYESAVDSRTGDYGFSYDGMDNAKAGATIRKLARMAHKKYWEVVNTYDADGYSTKVHRITKRQLKRAANAMADPLTELARSRGLRARPGNRASRVPSVALLQCSGTPGAPSVDSGARRGFVTHGLTYLTQCSYILVEGIAWVSRKVTGVL